MNDSASSSPLFNVVLMQPEIPNNTGCIGRTCIGARSRLHLVGPMGFEISDSRLKRAGLDYWTHLDCHQYVSNEEFFMSHPDVRTFVFSSHAEKSLYDVSFQEQDFLIFGCESRGLSNEILNDARHVQVQIPISSKIRSLNLATAVGISLFEGIRQLSR